MRFTTVLSALAAVLPAVHGHFSFVRLALNGEWQTPLRFIRNKTDPFIDLPPPRSPAATTYLYNFPTYIGNFPDSMRCGRGNMAYAADTEVMKVKTSDTLEFVSIAAYPYKGDWLPRLVQWDNCPDGRGVCDPVSSAEPLGNDLMVHPGPTLVHLSPVPEGMDIHDYDGSGEWIKIKTFGLILLDDRPDQPVQWHGYNDFKKPKRFIFKLPGETPSGRYLMRMDTTWPRGTYEGAAEDVQYFPTCAQIEVESEATGQLPKGIRIPEDMIKNGGVTWTWEMDQGKTVDPDYVYAGGPLWTGKELVEDKPPQIPQ